MIVAAHQELTQRWWRERGPRFEVVISAMVYREASGGDPDAAVARVRAIDELRTLTITDDAVRLADQLISKGPIPRLMPRMHCTSPWRLCMASITC